MVAINVRDRGPGLTQDQAARVFDKFYRVDAGLTRETEGTGLGLAICRGVVEAHGGASRLTPRLDVAAPSPSPSRPSRRSWLVAAAVMRKRAR